MREQNLSEILEKFIQAATKLIRAIECGNQELIKKYADEAAHYEKLLEQNLKKR